MTKLHPIIIEILNRRGIIKEADIDEFLSEKPQLTYDPFLLKNMREGVDFILTAIKNDKSICIYGDYDVDGITGAALLVQVLRLLTGKVSWYIPSRMDEGYGLNKDALLSIAETGVQVVITVDCGSVSVDEVKYGCELGLEMLVTDHHNTEGKIVDCLIINPKQEGETYPFKSLSGCGVAFKIAQALTRDAGLPRQTLNDVLDLVGIATIADVVPLVDENRTVTKYGLKTLRGTKRLGLRTLIRRTGLINQEISSENVAYNIAPHLNSAGRMADARDVVDLLLTNDLGVAERITEKLVEHNTRRKQLQEEIYDFCKGIAEYEICDDPIFVINAGDAHEGITGIVAGKLRERYYRPTLILTETQGDGGVLKGTGRSVPGIDLFDLLKKHEDCFEKFGGHAMACGFLLKADKEKQFRRDLIADVNEMLERDKALITLTLKPDAELTTEMLNLELVRELMKLAPFGNSNEVPLFVMKDLVIGSIVYMGDMGQHVKFDAGGISCIIFRNADDYFDILVNGATVTIFGKPSIDLWNGRERLQFIVEKVINDAAH